MIVVLSDIHGNLEALEAVLADMAAFDVEAVHCLGDVIGYGPDPIRCMQYAMQWPVVLRGDFEQAALNAEYLKKWPTSSPVHSTIYRFLSELSRDSNRVTIETFLQARPVTYTSKTVFYCHGSPRQPVDEYLFPEEIYNRQSMEAMSAMFDSLCLCGHTHLPGVFYRQASGEWQFATPEEIDYEFPIPSDKLICNVGSVGQPRDGDPRAGYVLLSPDKIQFRRVQYDIEKTLAKIRDNGDDDLGARLNVGV